jgi:hypothetical protein
MLGGVDHLVEQGLRLGWVPGKQRCVLESPIIDSLDLPEVMVKSDRKVVADVEMHGRGRIFRSPLPAPLA